MRAISSFVLLLLFPIISWSQGIDFFHGTWAEAKEKAKNEKKLIFVDAYASWCGPCKRMAKETFPDEKVGAYFNANFISMKLDMEKEEAADFRGIYSVESYPTLFFIDENGKIVAKEIGAKSPEELIATAQKVMSKNDRSGEYEKKYKEGNREPQLIYEYVKALNAASKPSLKITNEYLKTQTDLGTEFNLRFIFEGATEADSRVFDLLLKYKDKIALLVGEEALRKRIESACRATVRKSVEYKDEALLDEAKNKMKAADPVKGAAFACECEMSYYKAVKDIKKYLKAMDNYRKLEAGTPAKEHDLVVTLLRSFPNEPKVLDQAEEWAKDAAEKSNLPEHYMTLAEVYKRQGNKDKARKTAQKALELVGDKDSNFKAKIDIFLEKVAG